MKRLISILCITCRNILLTELLILSSRLIHTVTVTSTQRHIFNSALQIARVLRIRLSLTRFWVFHLEIRRVTIIGTHALLLCASVLSLSAVASASQMPSEEKSCPMTKSDLGPVPCSLLLEYIKLRTLDKDAEAQKMISAAQFEKK